eukprot:7092602-Prymnesium_polylepis.1
MADEDGVLLDIHLHDLRVALLQLERYRRCSGLPFCNSSDRTTSPGSRFCASNDVNRVYKWQFCPRRSCSFGCNCASLGVRLINGTCPLQHAY